MAKSQRLSMECLPGHQFEAILYKLPVFREGSSFQDFRSAIKFIVEQRVANMAEMNADLVGPSGFKPAFDERHVAEPFQNPVVCDRVPAFFIIIVHGMDQPVTWIAPHVAGDGSLLFREVAPNQSDIFPVDGMVEKLFGQP